MLAIKITNKIVNSEYLSGGLKSCQPSLQVSIANQLLASQPDSSSAGLAEAWISSAYLAMLTYRQDY